MHRVIAAVSRLDGHGEVWEGVDTVLGFPPVIFVLPVVFRLDQLFTPNAILALASRSVFVRFWTNRRETEQGFEVGELFVGDMGFEFGRFQGCVCRKCVVHDDDGYGIREFCLTKIDRRW